MRENLQWYRDNDIPLFPVKKGGKEPATGGDWRSVTYTEKDIDDFVDRGYNLGARIPSGMMVLDIDVRNGKDGALSLARLNSMLGQTLEREYPTVQTASGGFHIFMTVPETAKLRGKLDKSRWKDIDIKKHGGYVLTAGCDIHGANYKWFTEMEKPHEIPDKLLKISRKKVVDENSTDHEPGEFDEQDIEKILSFMNVREFNGQREDWLNLAMSIHYATNGDVGAREAFIDWSAGDEDYNFEEVKESHRNQWNLFTLDGGITTATLMDYAKKMSGSKYEDLQMELFGSTRASLDIFDDVVDRYTDFDDKGNEVVKLPFGLMSFGDLLDGDFTLDYLIDGVMTEKQSMVISGVSKSCKTTIALDMAISLATGTPFLGRYNVPEKKNVMFLSAETAPGTIQEKTNSMVNQRLMGCHGCRSGGVCYGDEPCLAYDLDINELRKRTYYGDKIPRIVRPGPMDKSPGDVERLRDACLILGTDVVFLDPAYLALPSQDSSNLNAQGEVFSYLLENLADFGVTIVLLHHNKKTKAGPQEPELHDMTGAGYAEFCRQWMLLGRFEPYMSDGIHNLHFIVGGSAGHSLREKLVINEGVPDKTADLFGGPGSWRKWEVQTLGEEFSSIDKAEEDKPVNKITYEEFDEHSNTEFEDGDGDGDIPTSFISKEACFEQPATL